MAITRVDKDNRTGVAREINDDYFASTYVPGATVIPSSRNNLGGTHRKKSQPIPMIIDPDNNGKGITITPDMLDNAAEVREASVGGDASAAYKTLSEEGMRKKKVAAIAPVTAPIAPVKTPVAQSTAPIAQQTDPIAPVKAPVVETLYVDPVAATANTARMLDAFMQRMATLETALSAAKVTEQSKPLMPYGTEEARVAYDAVMEGTRLAQESLERNRPQRPAQADVEAAMPHYEPRTATTQPEQELFVGTPKKPGVTVTFEKAGSAKLTMRCHRAVVQKCGDSHVLALVYDERFDLGDRIDPIVCTDAPYTVSIRGDGEKSYSVFHMGYSFNLAHLTFTVLVPAVSMTPDQLKALADMLSKSPVGP